MRTTMKGPRLVAIFLLGVLLFNYPLLALFNRAVPAFGVPLLYDFLRSYRPEKPAPQPADYSNLGFGLLGHLLGRIHGQSYATLIAARIVQSPPAVGRPSER